MHRCPNRACPSRGLESLINWVQAAADIEGVGEQLVRRLWELGLVRSLPELYRLTKEQLLELDGFAEIVGDEHDRRDRGVEGDPVPPRALRPEHPRRRLGDGAEPRAPLRRRRPARRRDAGGDHGVRGHRPRARRGDRRVVRRRGQRDARRRAARARAQVRGRRGRPAGRRAADRHAVRDHGHARVDVRARQARAALEALGAKVSDNVSKKTTGVVVGESPGSKVAKAEKAGVPLLGEADLQALLERLSAERRREAVLRLARRPRETGKPFWMIDEGVAVADVARERRRAVRRAGLRAHDAARRRTSHPLLERAVLAGDRQRAPEDRAQLGVVPDGDEQRRRAPARSAGRRARARSRRRSARRRAARRRRRDRGSTTAAPAPVVPAPPTSAPSCFSISSAVKLSLSRSISCSTFGERGRLDLRERVRVGRRAADARPRRWRSLARWSSCLKRPAAARAGCSARWLSYTPRSTTSAESGGDSKRKNDDFQPGAVRLRVEPRLVADDAPVDPLDPGGLELRGQPLQAVRGERRVAEPLQVDVAVPGRPVLVAGARAPRCGSGSRRRARRAPRT